MHRPTHKKVQDQLFQTLDPGRSQTIILEALKNILPATNIFILMPNSVDDWMVSARGNFDIGNDGMIQISNDVPHYLDGMLLNKTTPLQDLADILPGMKGYKFLGSIGRALSHGKPQGEPLCLLLVCSLHWSNAPDQMQRMQKDLDAIANGFASQCARIVSISNRLQPQPPGLD